MIEDHELLRELADDNWASAIDELYKRYADSVYGFGMRLFADSRVAERLVRATFLRLVDGARQFDDTRSSAARFIVLATEASAAELQPQTSTAPANSASEKMGNGSIERLLVVLAADMALQRLSVERREVLRLTFMEKLGQREIAGRVDVPLSTVKTRSLEALRDLKTSLEETVVA